MSQTGWSEEDETMFRLLEERRMRARERQRQAREQLVERMRDNNPGELRVVSDPEFNDNQGM